MAKSALAELFDNGRARDRMALRLAMLSVYRGWGEASAALALERRASGPSEFGLAAAHRSRSISSFLSARDAMIGVLDRHSRTEHGATALKSADRIKSIVNRQLVGLVADLTIKQIKEA